MSRDTPTIDLPLTCCGPAGGQNPPFGLRDRRTDHAPRGQFRCLQYFSKNASTFVSTVNGPLTMRLSAVPGETSLAPDGVATHLTHCCRDVPWSFLDVDCAVWHAADGRRRMKAAGAFRNIDSASTLT